MHLQGQLHDLNCTFAHSSSYLHLVSCLFMCSTGPSSVFELLDSKDREKLNDIRKASQEQNRSERDLSSAVDRAAVVASAKAAALQAMSSRFQSTAPQPDPHTWSPTSQSLPQPSSETQMALKAWSAPTANAGQTFKPFEKNPQKQARYDSYISRLKLGERGK